MNNHKLLRHTATWMHLKFIMLSEKSQLKSMILFIRYSRKGKTVWIEKRSVSSGTGAEEEVDYTGAQENFGIMGQFYILIVVVFT